MPKRHMGKDDKNLSKKAQSELMEMQGEKRSGSDSNAHGGRKHDKLHQQHHNQNNPSPADRYADVSNDLRPNSMAGNNHGMTGQAISGHERSASEIKQLHTTLADLTDDELNAIVILPAGVHLEQGAKYIDLRHLEQGEFVATADMVVDPEHYYVPKKETDYVLWNRLNQVDTAERLDENANQD
jgi:hypothetical protein